MDSQAWMASLFVCFMYAQAFGAGEGKQEATPFGRPCRIVEEALGLEVKPDLHGYPPVSQLCSFARRQFLTRCSQHVSGGVLWVLMK